MTLTQFTITFDGYLLDRRWEEGVPISLLLLRPHEPTLVPVRCNVFPLPAVYAHTARTRGRTAFHHRTAELSAHGLVLPCGCAAQLRVLLPHLPPPHHTFTTCHLAAAAPHFGSAPYAHAAVLAFTLLRWTTTGYYHRSTRTHTALPPYTTLLWHGSTLHCYAGHRCAAFSRTLARSPLRPTTQLPTTSILLRFPHRR